MIKQNLAHIEKVDLRQVFSSEAVDFTPWLAQPEGLDQLGKVLGLELELESQEQHVGQFRADILCKDTANNNWVVIENQIERTDHAHLGQILTYAAGLKAITIVWVAAQFTEEHRAALDWLNQVTDEDINFFGLEIELLRIQDSPIAPRFNVVCKPNDWNRIVTSVTRDHISAGGQTQLDYWTDFYAFMKARKSPVQPQKPYPQNWMNFALGRSNVYLVAATIFREGKLKAGVVVNGNNSKFYFDQIASRKEEFEKAMGITLDWDFQEGRKENHIFLHESGFNFGNKNEWNRSFEWIAQTIEKFHSVFHQSVLGLPYP
jgi:hypothetical protein